MSALLISIDRTSLGLGPLVLSGENDANPLGVTDYTEPAIQPRIRTLESDFVNGATVLSRVWQDTIVGFAVSTTDAATESESRALIAELREAVGQFAFTVTVTIGDAPAETWTCYTGSLTPVSGRNFADLLNHNPEWSVVIPAHPIRTIA